MKFLVQHKCVDSSFNTGNVNRSVTADLVQNDEIYIGEWCVFEVDSRLLVGMTLSFCYTAGETLKSRQYTKTSASISKAKAPIGVLGMWYLYDTNGKLTLQSLTHSFIGIENYKGSIPNPSYYENTLKIDNLILKKLDELAMKLS